MRMRGCGGWSRRRWDLWVTWRGGGWGMAHPAATSGQVRKSRCPSRAGGTGICVVRSVVMATLVLPVVGGIVGVPVGAALGAAIGRPADAAIFAQIARAPCRDRGGRDVYIRVVCLALKKTNSIM